MIFLVAMTRVLPLLMPDVKLLSGLSSFNFAFVLFSDVSLGHYVFQPEKSVCLVSLCS